MFYRNLTHETLERKITKKYTIYTLIVMNFLKSKSYKVLVGISYILVNILTTRLLLIFPRTSY